MASCIIKNEWIFVLALLVGHACIWGLGMLLPVFDTHWMLLLSAWIVAFPAIVCTFYYFVIQRGSFLSFKAIWLCQIVPVVVGILVSGFWHCLDNHICPGIWMP